MISITILVKTCHVATTGITEQNFADDFYQPYAPSRYIDGAKNAANNSCSRIKLPIHSRNGCKR